jgi:hypothetical protein
MDSRIGEKRRRNESRVRKGEGLTASVKNVVNFLNRGASCSVGERDDVADVLERVETGRGRSRARVLGDGESVGGDVGELDLESAIDLKMRMSLVCAPCVV